MWTLIFNRDHNEFQIIHPAKAWMIGMLRGDRVIRTAYSEATLIEWFNAHTDKERSELANDSLLSK